MKATMMKVSDPIIFGHCVEAYLGELLEKHGETLKNTGFNPNNGLSDFYRVLDTLDPEIQHTIKSNLEEIIEKRPPRHGQFGQRNYQPSCTKRCNH